MRTQKLFRFSIVTACALLLCAAEGFPAQAKPNPPSATVYQSPT